MAFKLKSTRVNTWVAGLRLRVGRFAPLDFILHPSPWRLRCLGMTVLLGQPLFGYTWAIYFPQPYENLWLRGVLSLLGGLLMLSVITRELASYRTQLVFTVIVWLEFPLFFSWMYLNNAGNAVWLSTVCASLLIYYHLTDWRIATAGTITGALLAWALFYSLELNTQHQDIASSIPNAMVIGFSWGCALLLGLSSADLRRAQLSNILTTIGIMAHELRTPLSTVTLLGDAMQLEVQRQPDNPRAANLEKLALRLHTLTRNMNHQIDTQIANAKLMQLPRYTERVSVTQLINDVVAAYPFQLNRQRECLKVLIHGEFEFLTSSTQFSQVLDNLIKNALHSLMAADSKFLYGALRIEAGVQNGRGRIAVTDQGMGIGAALLPHIFKPFFSNDRGTGHGLGLAFCRQVVDSAGGSINVKSEYAVGATFTIELPAISKLPLQTSDLVNPS